MQAAIASHSAPHGPAHGPVHSAGHTAVHSALHSAPHGVPVPYTAVHGAAPSASHRAGGDRRVLSEVVRRGGHRLRLRRRQVPPLARRAHGPLLATRPTSYVAQCYLHALHIHCIHSTHTMHTLYSHTVICKCTAYVRRVQARVVGLDISRRLLSLARKSCDAEGCTAYCILHAMCMCMCMPCACACACHVHVHVRRCQRWVGGLVGWWMLSWTDAPSSLQRPPYNTGARQRCACSGPTSASTRRSNDWGCREPPLQSASTCSSAPSL